MKTLVEYLKQHASYLPAQRLAENLELDCPSLKSTHPLSDRHGNNVSPEMEKLFQEKWEKIESRKNPKEVISELNNQVYLLKGGDKEAPFLLEENSANQCLQSKTNIYSHWFSRYFSIRSYYQYFLQEEGDEEISSQGIREKIDEHLYKLDLLQGSGWAENWLGIPPEQQKQPHQNPLPIWVVLYDQPLWEKSQFLTEQEKAWEVVRTLALEGFDTPGKRIEVEIGIMAIHFQLKSDIDLYKPTILDGLKNRLFFPGPRQQSYGLTYILDSTLEKHIGKTGVQEYICQSFSVPVKVEEEILVEKIGYFEE